MAERFARGFITMIRLRTEEGQDLIEYGLLASLIAIVAVGVVTAFGQLIRDVFWETIANNF